MAIGALQIRRVRERVLFYYRTGGVSVVYDERLELITILHAGIGPRGRFFVGLSISETNMMLVVAV